VIFYLKYKASKFGIHIKLATGKNDKKIENKLLTRINTDGNINAVKNSPASPTKKEKIGVNPCKSVS